MKTRWIITFLLIILGTNVFAQYVLKPESTVLIDENKLAYCWKVMNDVDSLPLRCDTLLFKPFDEGEISYYFKAIYFDKNQRLRKYFRKQIINDGSHECIDMFVYYDEQGDLVYIAYDGSYNCGSDKETYYVSAGHIVDFYCEINCDCCEEEDEEESAENYYEDITPVIGSKLERTLQWNMNMENFMKADKLLQVLKDENYSGYDEFE